MRTLFFKIFIAFFLTVVLLGLLLGYPLLSNALDIPSIQALRTPDVLKLIAAGWCVVLGVWSLLSMLWTRAEK